MNNRRHVLDVRYSCRFYRNVILLTYNIERLHLVIFFCNFRIATYQKYRVLIVRAEKLEVLSSAFHRRSFKFNIRCVIVKRNPRKFSSSTKAASIILNGWSARSHGITRRCPRNPLTSAYTTTTSAPNT